MIQPGMTVKYAPPATETDPEGNPIYPEAVDALVFATSNPGDPSDLTQTADIAVIDRSGEMPQFATLFGVESNATAGGPPYYWVAS